MQIVVSEQVLFVYLQHTIVVLQCFMVILFFTRIVYLNWKKNFTSTVHSGQNKKFEEIDLIITEEKPKVGRENSNKNVTSQTNKSVNMLKTLQFSLLHFFLQYF